MTPGHSWENTLISKSLHTHKETQYNLQDKEEQKLFKSQQSDGRVELIYFNLLQQFDTTNLVYTGQRAVKRRGGGKKKLWRVKRETNVWWPTLNKKQIYLLEVCFKLSALYRNNNNNKERNKDQKNWSSQPVFFRPSRTLGEQRRLADQKKVHFCLHLRK